MSFSTLPLPEVEFVEFGEFGELSELSELTTVSGFSPSEGNAYLHLPGVIVAESSTGETRFLLSDGLGSVRQRWSLRCGD